MAKELSDKILSEEELVNLMGSNYPDLKARAGHILGLTRHNTLWWAAREHRRITSGFYEVSSVLEALNTHGPYFAHVSKEDRNMVAFTPDKAAGEADRQIRMTIGRLLSKVYTIANDNWIADQIAAHTAELSNEVDWLEGGAIAEAYKNFGGIGACMTSEKFNNAKYHPASVYDAPGVKLAYLKDSEGKFTARSLVYEASETDKRYIRCFPSGSVLQKRLERLGYKAGNFEGAKLKAIFTKTDDAFAKREVVIPYIDGNNGYGSASHSTVIVLDGHLQVLHGFQASFVPGFVATKTDGVAVVPVHTTESLNPTCMLSGKVIDSFSGEKSTKFFKDGVAGVICNALVDGLTMFRQSMIMPDGSQQVVLAGVEDTLQINGRRFLNHKETLIANGLAKLDAEWYPELQEGYVSSYNSRVAEDGRICKIEDTVTFINSAGTRVNRHKSQIPENATKLHSNTKNELAFADSSLPVLKTVTGRKVHPSYNHVATPTIGKLDFTRNLKEVRVLGRYRMFTKADAKRAENHEMWPELCEVIMAEREEAHVAEGYPAGYYANSVAGLVVAIQSYESNHGGRGGYRDELQTRLGSNLRSVHKLQNCSFEEAERFTWMIIKDARANIDRSLINSYGHGRTISLKQARQALVVLSHQATKLFADAGAVEYPNRTESVAEVNVEEVLSAQAVPATVEFVSALPYVPARVVDPVLPGFTILGELA